MSSDAREIVARGLTKSSIGSLLEYKPGKFGIITAVDWFDSSMSIQLSINVDIPNTRKVKVYDA